MFVGWVWRCGGSDGSVYDMINDQVCHVYMDE